MVDASLQARGRTLNARLSHAAGDDTVAIQSLQESLGFVTGATAFEARLQLGKILAATGEWERARQHLEAAEVEFAELGDIHAHSLALIHLAGVHRSCGDIDRAEALLLQARGSGKAIGSERISSLAWAGLAEVALCRGRIEEAVGLSNRAVGFAQSTRLAQYVHHALLCRVRVYMSEGRIEDALALCEQCRMHVPSRRERYCTDFTWVQLMAASGQVGAAFEHCRKLQSDVRYFHEAAPFWNFVALLCGALGRLDGETVAKQRAEEAAIRLSPSAASVLARNIDHWRRILS